MEFIRIVVLCVIGSIVYGVLHNQVTVRISLEYFTVAHERIMINPTPTVLAAAWGVLATWWAGLLVGLPVAVCCRVGRATKLDWMWLAPRLGVALACMGGLAVVAAVGGRALAATGVVRITPWLAERVPEAEHVNLLTAGFAHGASYAGGVIAGAVLCTLAVVTRRQGRGKAAEVAAADAPEPAPAVIADESRAS
ncbi:MAG: hypothetical protein LW650_04005 [Planctomycetaceae bacterium]|nr:hypothetical protein [Phycisphaerales bacterium]MCE2652675.1 hypothetical protein [Planctomycetaceae bacterium]